LRAPSVVLLPDLHAFPTRRSSDLAQAGMVDAGLIALDGTKVQANASVDANKTEDRLRVMAQEIVAEAQEVDAVEDRAEDDDEGGDRKSTRLNSSHVSISYAVFCLK